MYIFPDCISVYIFIPLGTKDKPDKPATKASAADKKKQKLEEDEQTKDKKVMAYESSKV